MARCLICGSDDLIEYANGPKCQRCGAQGDSGGSWSYDPDEIEGQIEAYDDFHDRDR